MATVSVTRIPDPQEAVPAVAWPAVALFAAGIALWIGPAALALAGAIPLWVSPLPQAVGSYLLFTVAHDASHRSVSTSEAVNVWLGRIAIFLVRAAGGLPDLALHPHAAPPVHQPRRRPRPRPLHPPRPALADAAAVADDRPLLRRLVRAAPAPAPARREDRARGRLDDAGGADRGGAGHRPRRRAAPALPAADAARGRVARLRVVHHLHPRIPFHRYLAVWRRNEDRYLEGGPELSDVRGRPITVEEYRRLQELAE